MAARATKGKVDNHSPATVETNKTKQKTINPTTSAILWGDGGLVTGTSGKVNQNSKPVTRWMVVSPSTQSAIFSTHRARSSLFSQASKWI